MDEQEVVTGTVSFTVPSIEHPCSTFYKVIGDLKCGNVPVVILHGGPGSGHEYLLPFAALWTRHKLPVILYDQIGCAASTHLKEKAGDDKVWTVDLFIRQLESVLDRLQLRDAPGFHLLGHSFGGMLVAHFASQQPRGLQKLIIANSPASFQLYADSLRLNRKQLSQETQQALEEADQTGDYTSQKCKEAEMTLIKTFWCRANPFPPGELEARMRHQSTDQTSFKSLYGPNLFQVTGSLRDWDCTSCLPRIKAPTLVYNGEYDMVHRVAWTPVVANISGMREAVIKNASHMSHLDDAETREEVLTLVGSFLSSDSST